MGIDIRAVYREFYRRKPQGLNGALRELGLGFEGREHSGIEDARNTARLVWRMVQDGCQLASPCNTRTTSLPSNNQQTTSRPSSVSSTSVSSRRPASVSSVSDKMASKSKIPKPSKMVEGDAKSSISAAIKEKEVFKTPIGRTSRSIVKTPINGQSSTRSSTTPGGKRPSPKGTPPFCQCGKRSKKRIVWKMGPNQGRVFFGCNFRAKESLTGCGFFTWADGQ